MKSVESYDLLDPETIENPFEYYRVLREHAPVHPMQPGMYIVSTHALCVEAVMDPGTWSSKFVQKMSGGAPRPDGDYLGPETLLSNDPPEHTDFRKLVNKAFSPNRVKQLSASIHTIADDLVSKIEQGDGRFDAVADLAVPLPVTVIADQLGVPCADLGLFKKWSDATIVPMSGTAQPAELIESLKLVEELKGYLAARSEERRAEPQDDMLSVLVQAELAGGRSIETKEVVSLLQQFLVAGNETTTNLIAATLMFLYQNPDQLAKVEADRSLLPNAIEEALRLETPTCGMWRVATRDAELGGVTIPEGSMVMLRYAAANRDEAVFDDAEAFKVDRPNTRDHLAFGMGIHYCPGAALGREETRIAIELCLDRLPGLRLAEGNDFAHHPNMLLRGLKRLDMQWSAG